MLVFRYVLLAVALAVVTLFAMYVWPTRWRYGSLAPGNGTHFEVRIDRFTGQADVLWGKGWRRITQ